MAWIRTNRPALVNLDHVHRVLLAKAGDKSSVIVQLANNEEAAADALTEADAELVFNGIAKYLEAIDPYDLGRKMKGTA